MNRILFVIIAAVGAADPLVSRTHILVQSLDLLIDRSFDELYELLAISIETSEEKRALDKCGLSPSIVAITIPRVNRVRSEWMTLREAANEKDLAAIENILAKSLKYVNDLILSTHRLFAVVPLETDYLRTISKTLRLLYSDWIRTGFEVTSLEFEISDFRSFTAKRGPFQIRLRLMLEAATDAIGRCFVRLDTLERVVKEQESRYPITVSTTHLRVAGAKIQTMIDTCGDSKKRAAVRNILPMVSASIRSFSKLMGDFAEQLPGDITEGAPFALVTERRSTEALGDEVGLVADEMDSICRDQNIPVLLTDLTIS